MVKAISSERTRRGYALLLAIIGVALLTVMLTMAIPLWQTEIKRDMEEEIFFRARQYVNAIEAFQKKHAAYPRSLNELYEEKLLRKLYSEPLSPSGRWDLVLQVLPEGGEGYMVVPEEAAGRYLPTSIIVGVCPTTDDVAFRIYRKKKRYNEWAFYVGDSPNEEMPEIRFVGRE